MRKTGLVLLFAVIFAAAAEARAAQSSFVTQKANSVDLSVRILRDLATIARQHTANYPSKQLQIRIRKLLTPLRSVDDLSRFALLSSAVAGGQLAEHQNYDGVFDFAEWECIERLAMIPGEEAHIVLEFVLRPVLGRDGHPSEQFTELIAKQRRISKAP